MATVQYGALDEMPDSSSTSVYPIEMLHSATRFVPLLIFHGTEDCAVLERE